VRLAQSRWVARTRPVVDLRPFVKSHRLNRSEPTPPNASIRARKIVRRIRSRGIPRCLWAPNDSDRYRSWTHPLTLLTLTPSPVRGNSDSVEQTLLSESKFNHHRRTAAYVPAHETRSPSRRLVV
jgi:hypothetical protein